MKFLTAIIFIIFSIESFSQLLVSGSLDTIKEKREKAIFSIEIWVRPVDPLTGRRPMGTSGMGDSLSERFTGFSIGKGYILTASHPFDKFLKKMDRKISTYYLKVFDYKKRPVIVDGIGKCGKKMRTAEPDICILKGWPYDPSFFELPKELNLDPSESIEMGLVNSSSDISKIGELLTGKFKKSLTYKKDFNSGMKLWITTIDTGAGNSGSPIFDMANGKILGMTTTSVTMGGRDKAEVIPIQYIRAYLNFKDWKMKKLPTGMQDYSAVIFRKNLKRK